MVEYITSIMKAWVLSMKVEAGGPEIHVHPQLQSKQMEIKRDKAKNLAQQDKILVSWQKAAAGLFHLTHVVPRLPQTTP